jgi:hypothetical protein
MNDTNMMQRDLSSENMGPDVKVSVQKRDYDELIAAWRDTSGLYAFAPRLARALHALDPSPR